MPTIPACTRAACGSSRKAKRTCVRRLSDHALHVAKPSRATAVCRASAASATRAPSGGGGGRSQEGLDLGGGGHRVGAQQPTGDQGARGRGEAQGALEL